MKEYITTLYDRDGLTIKRYAAYHPDKMHEPFVLKFDIYTSTKHVARCDSLSEVFKLFPVQEHV